MTTHRSLTVIVAAAVGVLMLFFYVDTADEVAEEPPSRHGTEAVGQTSVANNEEPAPDGMPDDSGSLADFEGDPQPGAYAADASSQLTPAVGSPASVARESSADNESALDALSSSDGMGLDGPEVRVPRLWGLNSPTLRAAVDDFIELTSDFDRAWNGSASAVVRAKLPVDPNTAAGIFQPVNAHAWQGKRVRFSGYLLVESMFPDSSASAEIWIRADDAAGRVVAFQNTRGRYSFPEPTWQEVSIVIDIPADAWTLFYGALLIGSGSVWIDSMSIEEVGPETPLTSDPYDRVTFNRVPARNEVLQLPTNLDFEQTQLREDQQ